MDEVCTLKEGQPLQPTMTLTEQGRTLPLVPLGVEASSTLFYVFMPGDALRAWKMLRGLSDDDELALDGMTSLVFSRNTEVAEGESTDPSEPGDTLWRAIDWHRSGKRGQSQKLTCLRTGLRTRVLSNTFPWILDGGSEYIANSRASVRFEVLAQAEEAVWISSEEEAEEPPVVKARSSVAPKGSVARQLVIRTQEPKAYSISSVPRQPLFPPPQREPLALVPLPKSEPAAKASGASSSSSKAAPKAPPPQRGSSAKATDASSSTSKVELKKAEPKPPQQQQLKPTVLLPDSATLYCWDHTEKPFLVGKTRGFRGTCGIYTEYPPEGKVLLVLDWYQTLSRSRTASAEAIQKIPEENLELLQKLKNRYQNRLVIAICSFISGSERNLTNLLEACGNTRGLSSLVSFITITRQKCGPQGKLRMIESLCQRLTPAILVDDNAEIVSECSTMGGLAEDPNAVLPLGTGSQGTMQAIGDDDDDQQLRQSPDGTLSQFIRSPGSHDQVVPLNPFRVPPGGDPSSTGPVGTPDGANFVQQNNLKQEYHQHQYQTNVRQELNVSLDPLLVAQAHHVVEQNRASAISQAQEALNQSRDQLRDEANQAVIQAQEAAKAEALTYVQRVEAEAKQHANEAQIQIEQIRQRAAESSTELRNKAKAEVAMVEAEANRKIATLEGRISELTHERDNLAQMVQGMLSNQGGFENTVQSLMEEKETLVNRVQSLMINQDVLEGDIRSLMDEREMLTKRVQMLIDEKQDTIQKAQRMLDERDTLISELTGRLQALNSNKSTAMRQPALAIVEAGNGAGSSKGLPKNEVKSKQPVETAIQEMRTMLEKLEQRVSRSPSAVSHKSNSSSSSSSKKGGGGSPGNSSGGGSNGSPKSSNGSSSSGDDQDPYKFEKKYMRVKGYDAMKFPMIPKNAAEARGYRNSIYSAVCKLAKKDESQIFAWISMCNRATQASEIIPGQFPILDRIIGHKLLESSRGTRFSLDFQTVQESYQKRGRQPSGRLLLWTVFQKFKLDKDRGASLSQHHLLALKLEGISIMSLIDFKSKFDYIAGSLEQVDMPSDQALRSLLFENLKSHPKLTLAIDKFREARVGSSKRTWDWLYQKMEEAIEIDQLDENTGHVEKALQSSGGHKVNANAAKTDDAKPDKPKKEKPTKTKEDKPKKEAKEKTEKPKKEKKTSEAADASVAAAPGQSKGKSKGKGTEKPSASSSTKPSKEDKKKDPCMYFAYSACTKGDQCPYLHDKNNLYKGPKPKALTMSHAGAAQIVSGAVAATTILGTEGASSLTAPCRHVVEEECCSTRSGEGGSDFGAVNNRPWREFIEESNVVKLGRRCKPTKKDQRGKMFSCPRMFEKAIKCFAAIAAVCEPSSYHQEFLVDSGAGRNLISYKDMPEPWNHYVAEAPEQLKFATGGGLRPSTKAIRLKGSLPGEGVFYTLRDCPAALSLGQQVNEQGRAWIWFPNQLPFFVKSNRLADVTFHCPESAKIYVDRVEQNVPILAETVECLAMPAVDDPSRPAASSSGPIGDDALREGEKPLRAPSESAVSVGEKPSPAPPESDVPPAEALTRDVDERLLERDPEIGSDYTPSVAEDVPKEDPATGGELVLASDPSRKDPPSSDDEVEEISANHQLTHYPKSRSCEVCMRAKMTSRYHRKRGDPDPDEAPPLHFGHQIRVDHLIMGSDLQKGSEGEQACLTCFDEFSGCYQAFPQTQRTTENNIACLRKFGGTKAHGKALRIVKSDAAKELTEAVKALDWLPDEAIPNDAFHNAKLESNIRRLKEGVRACHLAAGFSHELWPRSMEYFCAAKARDEGGSGELPKIALPFEEGAPKTPSRVRRIYVTLERAIKFGKTAGCKGCERIAEGVKHSDACHERFRSLLEEESKKAKTGAEEKKKLLALEDKPKSPSEPSRGPEIPDFENLMESVFESDEAKSKAKELPAGAAKTKARTDTENLGDYWEYDQDKGAWCKTIQRLVKQMLNEE
eukprot:Skav230013  [mRNA]  locus=scaffold1958:420290:428629:+ [translate_table: standard]